MILKLNTHTRAQSRHIYIHSLTHSHIQLDFDVVLRMTVPLMTKNVLFFLSRSIQITKNFHWIKFIAWTLYAIWSAVGSPFIVIHYVTDRFIFFFSLFLFCWLIQNINCILPNRFSLCMNLDRCVSFLKSQYSQIHISKVASFSFPIHFFIRLLFTFSMRFNFKHKLLKSACRIISSFFRNTLFFVALYVFLFFFYYTIAYIYIIKHKLIYGR